MSSRRDWSAKPLNYALALLVAATAVVFSSAGLFDPVEDALTSSRAGILNRPSTGEVAIVEIDAKSLAELRSWPWPRRYHAEVVRKLHGAGASIIAFDVDFSARSHSGDEEFAKAIREAGHVVLPVFEQNSSGRNEDGRTLASRPDAAFSDAWVGGVNIFPDRDGMVREYPAATMIAGAIQPSIATLVAETHSMGDRSFEPDWAIDKASIPRLSFADVIAGRFSPNDIRGKRVLIGATAVELGDRYAVPRYGVVPGVVVQALAAESLLQDRAIQRTGSAVTIVGILLIVLAACAATAGTSRAICGFVRRSLARHRRGADCGSVAMARLGRFRGMVVCSLRRDGSSGGSGSASTAAASRGDRRRERAPQSLHAGTSARHRHRSEFLACCSRNRTVRDDP